MTSCQEFYFALLRVSIIQLLKSQGFDRAKPSSVDALTDLYARYLGLLAGEIVKLAQARLDEDDTIALQDITTAFQNLGIFKPVDVLDVYDENPELPSDLGALQFKKWCTSDKLPKCARIVGLPTGDLLKTASRSTKPLSLIPEYINQLQNDPQREENFKENEQDEKFVEDLINNGDVDDWIRLVLARQRISLAKKITGKKPHDTSALPSITGLKNSVLSQYHLSTTSHNQLLPASPMSKNEELSNPLKKGAELMKMLPAMRPELKVENVDLSYDTVLETPSIQDDTSNEVVAGSNQDQIDMSLNFGEYGNESGVSRFGLDSNEADPFYEIEDMNNTFQRRESLDFQDQPNNLRFDLNEF